MPYILSLVDFQAFIPEFNEAIRREIVTKLELQQFLPAIRADVAGVEGDQPALAQDLDQQHYRGLLPYGSYVARVVLFHSLAFNASSNLFCVGLLGQGPSAIQR